MPKTKKMQKYFYTLLVFGALSPFNSMKAQSNTSGNLWKDIRETEIKPSGKRMIQPTKYLTFKLDATTLKNKLKNVTLKNVSVPTSALISLPHADGQFHEYRVFLNTTMHPDLAAKYNDIRTYDAIATNGSGNTAKIDLTPQGFHAMILSPNAPTVFIDPYFFGSTDAEDYIIYSRADFQTDKLFECKHVSENTVDVGENEFTAKSFGSCELRTYRLALSATAEYTAFQGGTVALAQAAQVTTMNRVNGVYERDMSITMVIIPNNNLLIYTNAASDPYTNGNADAMYDQNQSNVTTVIGSANFDIGHVFGTNSGGLAGLGVVCSNSSKAQGVTGSSAPVGDPFDIDYVAHEMGHQFRANHTFNNSCGGNRNSSTAMEPGSGSTLMAYAGICAPNVQSNSNDYFHGISMQEIGNFVTSAGHTCPVKTPLTNTSPTMSGVIGDIVIPINTPFALTANATDAESNTLTYCWEQMNRETSTQAPVATATGGPNFRSFSPTTNPTRYLPSIDNILSASYTWERLPSVARVMKFRVMVRDNAAGGGCNDHADINVTTSANSGPFIVTYPSIAGITWAGNSTQTVTWDVANTNLAPVSCDKVNILISTDGGDTFTTLKSNTDNDGSETVVTPNIATTNAIIMVISSSGTFFDISDKRFRITQTTSTAGIEKLSQLDVKLYPNPTNNQITADFGQLLDIDQLSVTDALGRVIFTQSKIHTQNVLIDLDNETPGIYFLNLNVSNENKVLKIIKK